jgi:hypothetical protein
MADRILLESSATDGILLEDGTGVLLIEDFVQTSVPNALMMMGIGNWAILFLFIFL